MTHEQIDRMVRRANPVRDPNSLGSVAVPVLTTPLERRMEMQIDDRPGTEVQANRNRWRGPLIGIAAAAAILVAGLVFVLTRDNTPVAEPAPNATRLTADFVPIEPGAYFADTDADESTTLRGTFVIEGDGWQSLKPGALKQPVDGGPYVAFLVAQVDQVWEPACEAGRTPQPAATTAEGLANQFVAAGFTTTGDLAPVSAFGYEGYHLATEVRSGCLGETRMVWAGPNWGERYYQSEDQPLEFWFLDVEGTPVLVEASWWPETPEEDVAELRAVLDTLVITP